MQNKKSLGFKALAGAFAIVGMMAGAGQARAAATIIINNINGAGVGFNDTTPVAPVGGNNGTTLGQQRLIAFTYAANVWGATLTSSTPIVIQAQFSALTCTATSAVLGSAGATQVFTNFPNAPRTNTWYSYALANKLAGADVGSTQGAAQINANFNVNLGLNPNCLPGSPFYLGLDGNHGTAIDFVEVLLHEMGHGIGFQTFTNGSTGAQLGTAPNQFPSIWDHYLLGTVTGKLWTVMTPAERVASAISLDKLVWTGALVNNALPGVLRFGLSGATFSGPAAAGAAGTVRVGEAPYGAQISSTPFSGEVMPVVDQPGGTGPGCEAFNAANRLAVNGKFALISRGVCGFTVKIKNAQDAGAIGVLIADNAPETAVAPSGLGGADPTITIPAFRIFQSDGNTLTNALKRRSRTSSGVFVSVGLVVPQYAGADSQGRMLMYAPNPFQGGSSVSHYDTSATPNQLMEPSINGDLTQNVLVPVDLTFKLLQDIGW